MKNHNEKGFTLVELMLVVGIIGILSAIAMAFYGENVIKSNRTDGRAALTRTAASLEKCKSLYGTYDNANCNVALPFTSEAGFYTISAARGPAIFTLTATPVVGQPQATDSDCTTLTLTNTEVRSGTGADITECW